MQEFIANITTKGRITIPVEVRRYLGLANGDEVVFIIDDDGHVRIQAPRYSSITALRGAAGSLKQPLSWQETQKVAYEDRLNRKDTDA